MKWKGQGWVGCRNLLEVSETVNLSSAKLFISCSSRGNTRENINLEFDLILNKFLGVIISITLHIIFSFFPGDLNSHYISKLKAIAHYANLRAKFKLNYSIIQTTKYSLQSFILTNSPSSVSLPFSFSHRGEQFSRRDEKFSRGERPLHGSPLYPHLRRDE